MIVSKVNILLRLLLAAVLCCWPAEIFPATAVLTLTVTGTISSTPVWQDATSVTVTTVAFSYDGIIAGSVAAINVDSQGQSLKLVNAIAYPATVALVRPSGCTIGATNVGNNRVAFMNGVTEIATDTTFTIASNALVTYKVRFTAAGGVGNASGLVSCTGSGSLTYTY